MNDFEKACDDVDKELFTGEYEQENAIEFIKNAKVATATFSQKAWITKIMKLAEKHPNDVQIVTVNKREDGIESIVVHFPVSFIHISSKKRTAMTDEQRQAAAERLKLAREKRFGTREITEEEEAELEAELEVEDDDE